MASDWTNIPQHLLISIAERLISFQDLAEFGVVCPWWRSAVEGEKMDRFRPQFPWLTKVNQTAGQDQRTEIHCLTKQRAFLIRSMPGQAYPSTANLSSRGWILSSDGLHHSLIHPLKGSVFQLPDLECTVQKFLYTEDKSVIITDKKPSSPNCRSWVWRSKSPVWIKVVSASVSFNLISSNGLVVFYLEDIMGQSGFIRSYNPIGGQTLFQDLNVNQRLLRERWFLAESGGDIFFVEAKVSGCYGSFEVSGFSVFAREGRENMLLSLGSDRALFVGDRSSSFFVKASDFAGLCEPDCIYFAITDVISGTYVDAGVFRMSDGMIEHSLRGHSPHTFWVQPTFEMS